MPVNVISTIKPKNQGTFPVAEAVDIKVTDDLRLDAAYSDITATLDGYVTPQKFGAVGDGTTDDTSAFQSAIASGNKIFIPKGEYKITSRLSIPSGTILTGDGVGTVIKSYDDDGTFLIGDNVIIEKFRVSVESISTSGNVFEISENSLAECELIVPALNTIINAIDVVWNASDCTHCSVFSLSCEATFGTHNLTGYYAVRITNCSSLSTADKNVGYFARIYARNGKWVTGCEVGNANIYGCRWTYMSGYSDETSDLNDTTTKGCDGLLLNRIQHQCTTNARGFFYIRNNESVNVTDCIPWDWGYCAEDEFKNHPYVMPSSRYNRTNAVQSKPIEISPKPPSNQFLMLKSDGTFKKLISADAYLVHQATGKTDLFLPNIAKPMQLGNGENNFTWLYFNGKIDTDSYIIKFRLILDGITSDVTMYMGDNPFDHESIAPYILCDNIPSGVSFLYKCDNYDEFFLYIKKKSGNFTAEDVAISYPISSASQSYSGISGMANKIGTINTFNYGADSRYLSETPSGVTTITNVKTIDQDKKYLSLGDGENNSSWIFFSGKLNTDFYAIKMKLVIDGETIDLSMFMGDYPFDHENMAPYIIADRIPSNISFRYRTNQYDEFYLFVCNSTGNFTRKDYAIVDDIVDLSTSKNKIGTVNTFSFGESRRFESGTPYSTQKITDITAAANAADLDDKVDKVSGKGLSTNDFTTAEKTKLDDLVGIKSIGTGLSLNSAGKLSATGGGDGDGDGEYAVTLTPEQYGAVGDGTTDDTQAFQDMFDAMYAQSKSLQSYYDNNGTPTQRGVNNVCAPAVTLTSGKEYLITDTVHIKSPACRIIGNNAKIKSDNQNRVLGFDVFSETVSGQTVNYNPGWLTSIEGVVFVNCLEPIYFDYKNIEGGMINIARCRFNVCTGYAITTNRQSCVVSIRECIFEGSERYWRSNCNDMAIFEGNWASWYKLTAEENAPIKVTNTSGSGKEYSCRIIRNIFVPCQRTNEVEYRAWINASCFDMTIEGNRFGGEPGAMPIINTMAGMNVNNGGNNGELTAALRIINNMCSTVYRSTLINVIGLPSLIEITGNKGFYNGQQMIKFDPSLSSSDIADLIAHNQFLKIVVFGNVGYNTDYPNATPPRDEVESNIPTELLPYVNKIFHGDEAPTVVDDTPECIANNLTLTIKPHKSGTGMANRSPLIVGMVFNPNYSGSAAYRTNILFAINTEYFYEGEPNSGTVQVRAYLQKLSYGRLTDAFSCELTYAEDSEDNNNIVYTITLSGDKKVLGGHIIGWQSVGAT